jgi:hypothetical protein
MSGGGRKVAGEPGGGLAGTRAQWRSPSPVAATGAVARRAQGAVAAVWRCQGPAAVRRAGRARRGGHGAVAAVWRCQGPAAVTPVAARGAVAATQPRGGPCPACSPTGGHPAPWRPVPSPLADWRPPSPVAVTQPRGGPCPACSPTGGHTALWPPCGAARSPPRPRPCAGPRRAHLPVICRPAEPYPRTGRSGATRRDPARPNFLSYVRRLTHLRGMWPRWRPWRGHRALSGVPVSR